MMSEEQKVELLERIVRAIERIHGRIGKILLAQYLCGSQNSKLQKLNLHRLSGFGLLTGFRQADGLELIELLLVNGLLRQQEVNRNRPTVSISPQLLDVQVREQLLSAVQIGVKLEAKLAKLATAAGVLPKPTNPVTGANQTDVVPLAAAEVAPRPLEQAVPPLPSPHMTNSPVPAQSPGNGAQPSPPPPAVETRPAAEKPDWLWTLSLFKAGYDWKEVTAVRRMTEQDLANSLIEALQAGANVERSWLLGCEQAPRTAGQQQVVQEIRRQSAAWSANS